MWKRLCPALYLKNLVDLKPQYLQERGLKGVMLDLDNTLVEWGQVKISPATAAWVQEMKQSGLKLCIVSNALEERVKIVGEALGIPWVSRAIKPRKLPFKKALALLGTSPGETATIGDQLFTDICGGNRMALFTIWTTPLSTTELLVTKMVRRLEKVVARKLRKKGIISD
ncbi:MAG TPA: YqeG family HAD IIIA-type phosphatase [Firmicutes bacterium]|nr:YqeG family HAD IIIA-type phosphatase [Bacillota bacterium]